MEFRILGPLEVWDGEGEVSLGGPKPRALLTVLLLHLNEVVPADRLIDELWGEDSPERAAAALRVNVSRLRKALPEDVLTPASSCSWTRLPDLPTAPSSSSRDPSTTRSRPSSRKASGRPLPGTPGGREGCVQTRRGALLPGRALFLRPG